MKREAIASFQEALHLDGSRPLARHMLSALEEGVKGEGGGGKGGGGKGGGGKGGGGKGGGGKGGGGGAAPSEYERDLFDDYSSNFDESLKVF
jgi:hypothetical protein